MAENIYQMYTANSESAGFWVQRESWGNTCACAVSVAGQIDGPLPGKPPYHGNPEVITDVYDIHTGEMKSPEAVLSCPGN